MYNLKIDDRMRLATLPLKLYNDLFLFSNFKRTLESGEKNVVLFPLC